MTTTACSTMLLMGMPNAGELMILLVIIIVLFGGKKIPEIAKGLGQGVREFNEAKNGVKEEIEKSVKETREKE
jgi:sec-independent protein translocase protein TatA